jgi:hypothetical protein
VPLARNRFSFAGSSTAPPGKREQFEASTEQLRQGEAPRLSRHEQTSETANQNERTVMNDKFDELAKAMAQPVARRAALKRFGIGLAAFALAALGLTNRASAASGKGHGDGDIGDICRPTARDCKRGLTCRFTGGLKLYTCQK